MTVSPDEDKIKIIYGNWDKKEDLSKDTEAWWKSLTTAERREIRHTYEFEEED